MKELEEGSPQLSTALSDKEEWKVKIYVDLKQMKDCVSKTNPGAKEEQLVQDELNKKLNEHKQKSFGWMSKQACETKLDEIPPKESNQEKSAGVNHTVHTAQSIGKAMVLNSTYLVCKEDSENFTRVVKLLGEDYRSKGLEFECTGPKPPYNFLSVK